MPCWKHKPQTVTTSSIKETTIIGKIVLTKYMPIIYKDTTRINVSERKSGIALNNTKNYIYFDTTAMPRQYGGNIMVFTGMGKTDFPTGTLLF